MSAVRFPDSPACHSDGMVMHFTAIIEQKTIRCAIVLDALMEHFAKDRLTPPVSVFSRHRHVIERIAKRLIDQKRFENNGSILIRSSDC